MKPLPDQPLIDWNAFKRIGITRRVKIKIAAALRSKRQE